MTKFVIDHGKEIRSVLLNPQLPDEINLIAKCLLRSKKINQYLYDASATYRIETTVERFTAHGLVPQTIMR